MVEKNDVSLETQDSVDVKRNVPSLRFPKFKEKWKTLILDDVIKEFVNGQTPSRNHDEYWKGNIPWLSSGELNYGFINDSIEKITEKGQKSTNLRILPRNTFLIAIFGLEATGTRGSCGILNIPSTISQACMALIPYEEKLKMNFLYYWYNKVGDLYGVKYTQGTKQQNFNIELLKKLSITLPSNLEEQEKIANFLSLIDKKIELLEKTLVLYQRYKTYFLDTLINKNNSPLEKMSNIIRITSSKNKNNENLLVLSINNKLGFISQNDQFDNHKVASEDTSNYKIVEKDDFAYNPARINVGSIARLRNYNKGIVSPMYIVFKIDKDKVNLNYFENYIDSYDFRLNVLKRLEGSVRLVLSAEALKNIMIPLPNLNEQEKIGNFLEYNNKRIQLTNKKLEELKEYKKGLLQKMFC